MPHSRQQAIAPIKQTASAVRAAVYVRMSTEHQQYSTHNQMTAIEQYATAHQFSIVRTYADEGISGLTIKERLGLRKLVADVLAGHAEFSKVLVYDISRWGRFQDTDQSAFYEYLCRMNGIEIIYCAEPFENDHTPLSAVIKAVKRAMAAEYSRELSVKVSVGHCNLANRGYVQGGGPTYGLKHVVVGPGGKRIRGVLPTDRKTQQGCRVVRAPGPKKEIQVVREIFRRYVKLDETTAQIARYLNERGHRTRRGAHWNAGHIGSILVDEQYIGTNVYNRTSRKLKTKRKHNDSSEWVRKANAFEAIVEPTTFQRARDRRLEELRVRSDEELLTMLRHLRQKHRFLTGETIERYGGIPGVGAYCHRFGNIFEAYRRIGYKGGSRYARWRTRFRLRELRTRILDEARSFIEPAGEEMEICATAVQFGIGSRLSCSFQLSARIAKVTGPRWRLRLEEARKVAFHLVGRLNADHATVMDYYLIPDSAVPAMPAVLRRHNGREVDCYRLSHLKAVFDRLQRTVRPTTASSGLPALR